MEQIFMRCPKSTGKCEKYKSKIQDYLEKMVIEARVITKKVDFAKYDEEPTKYVD